MLAIIIPYYKLAYFEKTLESLAEQTNKNFNLYIGDDHSKENLEILIKKYEKRFNTLIYKRFKENLGQTSLTKQWDRCIDLTNNEEWLMLLGDDDFLSENYIEEFYKNLDIINRHNINVVRFASRIYYDEEKRYSKKYTHPEFENSTDSFIRKHFVTGRSSLSEHIFSRFSYNKSGFKDIPLAWGADNLAWLEFTNWQKIFTINEATCYVRISKNNISRPGYEENLKFNSKLLSFRYIISGYLKEFKKDHQFLIIDYFENLLYKCDRFKFCDWKFISIFFIEKCRILEFIKFQKRYLIRYFRKND